MGHALGEVPDIADAELLRCEGAVLVDAGEEETSVIDEAPFGLTLLVSDVKGRQKRKENIPPCASAAHE